MHGFEFLNQEALFNFASNPQLTQDAFNIQTTLVKHPRRSEMIQWSDKACLENAEFMDLYNRQYLPDFPTLEELQACPENSLGRALAKHLIDNGIQINFYGLDTSMFSKQDVNHITYFAARNTRVHDVYHVLFDLGTSPLDEYRLLNIQLAQFASPYHMLLLTTGYLHTVFFQPENIHEFLESNSRYYQIGKQTKFLAGFPFEDHWRTNLNEIRSMLRIPKLTS